MMNKIKLLRIKRRAKKENYPILKISDEVLRKYKVDIRNNEDDSDLIATLKLSRNYYSGQQILKNDNIIIKAYGCLHITLYRKNNLIIDIKNYKCYSDVKLGYIDRSIKEKLNELYKIELILKESK